jgi:hypothetical protein
MEKGIEGTCPRLEPDTLGSSSRLDQTLADEKAGKGKGQLRDVRVVRSAALAVSSLEKS